MSTLIVKHARFKDAGNYACVATVGKASAKCVVQLSVVESKFSIPLSLYYIYIYIYIYIYKCYIYHRTHCWI